MRTVVKVEVEGATLTVLSKQKILGYIRAVKNARF